MPYITYHDKRTNTEYAYKSAMTDAAKKEQKFLQSAFAADMLPVNKRPVIYVYENAYDDSKCFKGGMPDKVFNLTTASRKSLPRSFKAILTRNGV